MHGECIACIDCGRVQVEQGLLGALWRLVCACASGLSGVAGAVLLAPPLALLLAAGAWPALALQASTRTAHAHHARGSDALQASTHTANTHKARRAIAQQGAQGT